MPPSPAHDGAEPSATPRLPGVAEGTELAGEFAGSGYREPPRLVYRPDGQVVRLPGLLYVVVSELDQRRRAGQRTRTGSQILAEVAEAVSHETGRELTADHIAYLLDQKLAPLGVTTYSDGTPPSIRKANPFLSFRFRVAVLPARATWFLGGLFSWLYHPLVMVPAVAAIAASEYWVFATQNIGAAFQQTLLAPASILLVVALAVASAAFHEVGHGTACRYSGVRPGATGCGIYLVWPAFYTDITNSYRLGKSGRLRTDLGGVYFNGLFIIGLTLLYLYTGFQPLLIGFLATNLEIVQQLLPTLRFDGYYIIADLVGIPDLFRYIGPILRHTLLRKPPDQRLRELKRWPQIMVTIWVLCVLPALAAELGVVTVQFPEISRTDWYTINSLASNATASGDPVLGVVSACVQILLLLLPLAGVVVILAQLTRGAIRLTRAHAASLRALVARLCAPVGRLRTPVGRLRPRVLTPALATGMLAVIAVALTLSPSGPLHALLSSGLPSGQSAAGRPSPATRPTGTVPPSQGALTPPPTLAPGRPAGPRDGRSARPHVSPAAGRHPATRSGRSSAPTVSPPTIATTPAQPAAGAQTASIPSPSSIAAGPPSTSGPAPASSPAPSPAPTTPAAPRPAPSPTQPAAPAPAKRKPSAGCELRILFLQLPLGGLCP